MSLDHTHDPNAKSWVESANQPHSDFPIQNLPLGVFRPADGDARCGVAVGDQILDLRAAAERGLVSVEAVRNSNLDGLFALGDRALQHLRHELFALVHQDAKPLPELLRPMTSCTMLLPTSVRSYTDFFAGIHHAIRCAGITGRQDSPLSLNYHHIPIAYNGRASSVQVSGALVRRPRGLRAGSSVGASSPSFGPSVWLDFELELGFFIGPGNRLGEPIPIAEAGRQVLGFCLLNDWSARDIQFFEMAPLGAFNSKSFATTISPWVVTAAALAPFRVATLERFPDAPPLAAYLDDVRDRERGGLDLTLRATIHTARMRAENVPPAPLLATNARHLYWTFAQMVAQHTIGGCNLVPGDLLGTGTISAPEPESSASLFELSAAGQEPLALPNGERRTFLEDGDEVTFSACAAREGFVPIGFGPCTGRVTTNA